MNLTFNLNNNNPNNQNELDLFFYNNWGNSVEPWLISVIGLLVSANILYKKREIFDYKKLAKRNKDFPNEWYIYSTEKLLRGYAIEDLLKALYIDGGNIVAKEGQLVFMRTHNLIYIANQVKFQLSNEQEDLLKRFEAYIKSFGKYPISKNLKENNIKTSKGKEESVHTFPNNYISVVYQLIDNIINSFTEGDAVKKYYINEIKEINKKSIKRISLFLKFLNQFCQIFK